MPRTNVMFGEFSGESGVFCASCGQARDRDGRMCRVCARRNVLKAALTCLLIGEGGVAMALALLPRPHQDKFVAADTTHYVPPPPDGPTGWTYYDTTDTLLADITHHARLLANHPPTVDGKPAIPGATAGVLALAASTHYGKSVVVTFPPVATKCATPAQCSVKASFDQSDPVAFPMLEVASDRETTLILGDYDHFTERLRVAHDMTLVASLGGSQDVILNFTVQGYRTALRAISVHYAAMAPHIATPGRPGGFHGTS